MGTTHFDLPTYDARTDRLDLPKQLNDIAEAVDISLESVYQKIPLQSTMESIATRLTNLETLTSTHTDDIDMLRDDLDRILASITEIKEDISEIKSKIVDVEGSVTDTINKVEFLEGRTDTLESTTETLGQSVQQNILNINATKEWIQNSHDVEDIDLFMSGGVVL